MEYKKCECNECDIMIPIINTKGKPARFAIGHNFRGKNNPGWIGGEWIDNYGYIRVKAPENHPYKDSNGSIRKHRLIMEQHLGRYLLSKEQVHHKDNNILNNDISNLEILDRSQHSKITASNNPQCQKKDLSGRTCLLCKKDKTEMYKNGQPHWLKYQDGFICKNCYDKQRRRRNKIIVK